METVYKAKERLKQLGKAAIIHSPAWRMWYRKQQALCKARDEALRASRPSATAVLSMLSEIREEPQYRQPEPIFKYAPSLPLSIIVPVYNVERYLDLCLASITQQRLSFDFEVIAVNDGSTDGSAAILETWARKDKRIRIVNRKNGGLSAARNTGIEEAKGGYIAFVDSDDELTPGALEALMKGVLAAGADFCSGRYVRINENDEITSLSHPMKGESRYAWGRIYKRQVWDSIRWPEGYWYEDTLFSILLETQFTGVYIPVDVYRYRVRSGSIVESTGDDVRSLDGFWILRLLLEQASQMGVEMDERLYTNLLLLVGPTMVFKSECLDEKHRQALFFACCDLFGRATASYREGHPVPMGNLSGLEKALCRGDYYSWLLESVHLGLRGVGIKPRMAYQRYRSAMDKQDE